ncbi:MAG: DUF4333 domain-containing protein [Actinomycetota bacterium]
MPSRSRPARAAALLAIGVLAAACSRTLDMNQVESELKDQAEKEFGTSGLTVTCPDDVKVEAGTSFTCEASDASGATMVLTVTQENDQGKVRWSVTGAST